MSSPNHPDYSLDIIREAVQNYRWAGNSQEELRAGFADDAITAFQELDSWLSQGGFLPKPWNSREDKR